MKFSEFANIIDDKDALIVINGNLYETLKNSLLIRGINNFLYIDNINKNSIRNYWHQVYKAANNYKLHIINNNDYQSLSNNFRNYDVFSFISCERKIKNFFKKSYKLYCTQIGITEFYDKLEVKKPFKVFA